MVEKQEEAHRDNREGGAMRLQTSICLIVISGLLLFSLFFSGKRFFTSLRVPQTITLSFDDLFSENFKNEATEYIQSLDKRLARDPVVFAALIKDHFLPIDSIKNELDQTGTLNIAIKGTKPVCCINDDILLINTGLFAPKTAYEAAAAASCPQLFSLVDDLESWLPQEIIGFCAQLSNRMFEFHDVWLGQFPNLLLSHKKQPKVTMLARADDFDVEKIINRGMEMVSVLENRGSLPQGRQKKWVVDLRFNEQVVLVAK